MLKGKGSLVMQRFALTTSHFGQFSQHLRRVADIFSSFQCDGLDGVDICQTYREFPEATACCTGARQIYCTPPRAFRSGRSHLEAAGYRLLFRTHIYQTPPNKEEEGVCYFRSPSFPTASGSLPLVARA